VLTIVDKLLSGNVLDDQGAALLRDKLKQGRNFGEALHLAGIAEEQTLRFLAEELGLAFIELENQSVSKEFLAQFPAKILLDRHILPLQYEQGLVAVTNDPFDGTGIDELRLATGKDFDVALSPLQDIERCLKRLLGVGADTVQSMISQARENGLQVIDADPEDEMDKS